MTHLRRLQLTARPVLALVFLLAEAPGVSAQETPADSLRERIQVLEARVDSLLDVLRAPGAQPGDTAGAPAARAEEGEGEDDELEALRAAAREAAEDEDPERDDRARPDTADRDESRTRNLQVLNPEISVTGDVLGSLAAREGDGEVSAVPREFEFSFQSALDPFARTKIFVTRHEDFEIAGVEAGHEEEGEEHGEEEHGFEIEEGYAYWVGLPGGFGLKAGKFRQEIGLYNRWHTHALLEVDRPLATTAFLGEEGLAQTGLSAALPSFGAGAATQSAWLEVTAADNDALFDGGGELSYLGRLQSFLDLSPSSYLQVGATGVYGENDAASLTSRLLGVDLSYNWSPAGRSLYRELDLKGEWYWAEKDFGAGARTGTGGYGQASYRLDRRWVLGLRADYVDDFDDEKIVQFAPSISWWQSEWVRLRLQYNHVEPEDEAAGHTLLLQAVWAIGPHKHETY